MRIKVHSLEDTKKLAQNLAEKIRNKKKGSAVVLALSGDLGAGKTTFTQFLAEALGVKDKIISPTFIIVRQHQLPDTNKMFYHLDLYRLEGEIDIAELGLSELFEDNKNIIIIEWAEKIKDKLPEDTIFINIKKEDSVRLLHVTNF